MKSNQNSSSRSEQGICLTCGFCCDGTMFSCATLQPGEKGNLPEKIEEGYFIKEDKEFFSQPCFYFHNKCTIYNKKRAIICSSYRCQLLNDFLNKKLSQKDALEIVNQAMLLRREIFTIYQSLRGNEKELYFQKVIRELCKIHNGDTKVDNLSKDYKVLIGKCNIFEALLMKHFRSSKDFDSMMEMNDEGGKR